MRAMGPMEKNMEEMQEQFKKMKGFPLGCAIVARDLGNDGDALSGGGNRGRDKKDGKRDCGESQRACMMPNVTAMSPGRFIQDRSEARGRSPAPSTTRREE